MESEVCAGRYATQRSIHNQRPCRRYKGGGSTEGGPGSLVKLSQDRSRKGCYPGSVGCYQVETFLSANLSTAGRVLIIHRLIRLDCI